VTTAHVFYDEAARHLYRRVAGQFPLFAGGMTFDEDHTAGDGWLICVVPNAAPIRTTLPRERRAVCINEPSAMNCLPVSYLNQFGLLISPHRVPGFTGRWFESHTGLPWFFGAGLSNGQLLPTMSLEDLKTMKSPQKTNSISVVTSRKVFHDGHRKRLRLVELLKQKLGDRLLIYGRGIKEIGDKAEIILPSKYHLAIENTVERSYWTEKLSDALLGYALPIYGGCPNIHDWLPTGSVLPIDIEDPEKSCDIIIDAMNEGVYEQRVNAIEAGRRQILLNETVFHVIARAIAAQPHSSGTSAAPTQIHPPGKINLMERIRREARRVFHQVTFRPQLRQS
jgi:hypothetical protein